jgi:hypothetical protein
MKPWHGKKVEDLQKNEDDTKFNVVIVKVENNSHESVEDGAVDLAKY